MRSLKSVASGILAVIALVFLSSSIALSQEAPASNAIEQTSPTENVQPDTVEAGKVQVDSTESVPSSTTPADTSPASASVDDELPAQGTAEPSPELLADWLSVVVDKSLTLHNRELPAYRHYVNTVSKKSFNELKAGAEVAKDFDYFHLNVAKNRGKLVNIKNVTIRRIERIDIPQSASFETKQLYEMWGYDELSSPWLYVFITPELPAGMKEGRLVEYHAHFCGYFLKLQGYHKAGNADANKITLAPMLIGKFSAATNPPATPAASNSFSWQMMMILFLIVIVMSFRFLRFASVSGALSAIFPKRRIELKEDAVRDQRNLQWIESSLGQSDVDPKKDWP